MTLGQIQPPTFVLESIDPATGCIVADIAFSPASVNELGELAGLDGFIPSAAYYLDASDAGRLLSRYSLTLDIDGFEVRLRPWHRMHSLPYKIHTGRELALMLRGHKPLAAFGGVYPADPELDDIPEAYFDPYVAAGRFVKRESLVADSPPWRRVLYALPDEAWRIDALLLVHKVARVSGWNEGFERMEGTLLGYEDWQNDIFIATLFAGRDA